MVVMTAKLNKKKLAALMIGLVAVVLLLVLVLRGGSEAPENPAATEPQLSITTNEDRVKFLTDCGWEVAAAPVKTQAVLIPSESSEVYDRYNALQLSQGYDLTAYAGKSVSRYVYEVKNYPGATEPVYATLLVYNDNVVGGDVASSRQNGVMHGFAMPQAQTTGLLPVTDGEEISDNLS